MNALLSAKIPHLHFAQRGHENITYTQCALKLNLEFALKCTDNK